MELSIKSDRLKEIINMVSTIVTETRLTLNEDEFRIRAVDESHVAMVDVSLSTKGFERYDVNEENVIGLNLDKISQFLKLVGSGETIDLSKDGEKLTIEHDTLTQRIPLLDTESMSEPNIPDLDLPTEIKAEASYIKTGIKAASGVSDNVLIKANEDKFKMEAEEDQDEVDLVVYADEFGQYEIGEEVESLFALDKLKNMVSSVSSKAPIFLRLGVDYSIEIEYRFAEGHGQALMLLAPRVVNE